MICPLCIMSSLGLILSFFGFVPMTITTNYGIFFNFIVLLALISIYLFKKKYWEKRIIRSFHMALITNTIILILSLVILKLPNEIFTIKFAIPLMRIIRLLTIPMTLYMIYSSRSIKKCDTNSCKPSCDKESIQNKNK